MPEVLRSDLQELYQHLEHHSQGNKYMSYYGQLRASGRSHTAAIAEALIFFGIPDNDWYWMRWESHTDSNGISHTPAPNRLFPNGKVRDWRMKLNIIVLRQEGLT